jgi:hypothetical protein
LTAHIIERWHTGSASWPASVVSPAREGSYCNSRPTTTVEPIISSVERGNAFRQSPLAAYKAAAELARYWRHNEKTQFLPSWPD